MIPYNIEGSRHLLVAVGEMHRMGFQLVRIVPHLADSAGGGRWWCWLVPAGLTSDRHGADFTKLPPPEKDGPLPFFPYDQRWEAVAFPATPGETAATILRLYPELAAGGQGTDDAYATWYAEMLRLTHPLGLVIGSHFADGLVPPPTDGLRVVGGASGAETVPLPPIAIAARSEAVASSADRTVAGRRWWRFWE